PLILTVECCRQFCSTHGDIAVKARRGRGVAHAEVDYVRRTSALVFKQDPPPENIRKQRRASIDSWNSNVEQDTYISREPLGNQLALPSVRERRVSIASNEFHETVIFDQDKPPDTVKHDTEPTKPPERGILKH
uniref:Uncharacterized protein n=1 Tax=Ciona savignyi TaxID=51511 RepID=H2ZE55_CIOSA